MTINPTLATALVHERESEYQRLADDSRCGLPDCGCPPRAPRRSWRRRVGRALVDSGNRLAA